MGGIGALLPDIDNENSILFFYVYCNGDIIIETIFYKRRTILWIFKKSRLKTLRGLRI